MSRATKTDLRAVPFDPELQPGAENAIRTCLKVRPGERVTLITDDATLPIAAALVAECDLAEAKLEDFVLEDYVARPMADMPREILHAVANAAACIYAVKPQPGEVPSRSQVIYTATARKVRYGHMVGVDQVIMKEGMRADFDAINRMSLGLRRMLQEARTIHVRTPAGTDFVVSHDPKKYRWIKTSGLISRDAWGNLPGGEIFTHPDKVNGIWVCDGPIGDYFSAKFGDLVDTPLTVEIANNRLVRAHCDRAEVAEEFIRYCRSTENADRVGEVAVGTNLSVKRFTGNLLQDEKIPGFHFAFGEPCGVLTGANWTCKCHVDLLARDCDIVVDGTQIMEAGKFIHI